ncbi:MAG: hypothetical protein U1F07_16590 [Rubrivivax sp.]
MARIWLRHNQQEMRVIYDVDAAVGRNAPNRRDDVLLIQFFLRVAMENADSPGYRPPGQEAIAVDGRWGPQTQAYIDFFQQEAKRRNPARMPITDGRIDPLHTPFRRAPGPDQVHDIYALNRLYQKRHPHHDNLGADPLFPLDLTPSFY